jgi:hypothetical protein
MNSTELKRTRVLADLKSRRDALLEDIGAMELKIVFYASECSDGAESYRREMNAHIAKAKATVAELEPLIVQLESQPVQLELLAS